MNIEHVCLNVKDIEKEKDFYCQIFGFGANAKYHNAKTGWENYFLSSPDGGARLELLSHADLTMQSANRQATGIVHLSLALGSEEAVNKTTSKVASMGLRVLSEPRKTGDGYYESSFVDPEGNMIELTV
jgi:Lactoylglutathione lyase and related lyases